MSLRAILRREFSLFFSFPYFRRRPRNYSKRIEPWIIGFGKYGWNWDEYLQAQEDWLQADEDRLGIYIDNLTEKDMPISIEDVHELADTLNIPWDDNAEFMSWTKELTGKSHLDKMTNEELSIIYTALKKRGKEDK